jgi:hypothetical protein
VIIGFFQKFEKQTAEMVSYGPKGLEKQKKILFGSAVSCEFFRTFAKKHKFARNFGKQLAA